jgi:protein SCO1/2
MSTIRLVLWIAVAIALFGLGAIAVSGYSLRSGGAAFQQGKPLGGAFSLVDQHGEPITEAIFRGKPSATFFGFTHCPDVCPTALMEMTKLADELGPDADKLRFVFVTVDPERDKPQVMSDYISAFSPHIIGITGEPNAVNAMTRDYKIYSRKVPVEGGDYVMDHTAAMILQDANGNFYGTIATGESHETALAKLKKLVAG